MATLSEILWPAFHRYHACTVRGPNGSKNVLVASGTESAALDAMDHGKARAKSHTMFPPC